MNEPPNSWYFACGRSGQPIVCTTRRNGFATFQTSFTPSAQTCGLSPSSPNVSIATPVRWPCVPSQRIVTRARMSEPGSKFGEPLAEAAASLVAGSHSDDAPVLDEQLLRDGLREDRRARLLGLLREPARQLRQRGDVVPVVLHRRRRRDPQRAVVPQEVDALGLDLAVERHVCGPLLTAEQAPEAARVDDRAGERVRARLLALLEHGHRNLAQPLRKLRRLLDQLPEPDRAGEPSGAGADDQDPDLDPLVGRIRRLVHELARVELRRILGGPGARHQVLRCFTSSVSFGTISCTSPTTPRSQNSKIGAFGSLLIATTVPEPCMPTLCWIAPEIPQAT